MGWNSWNSGMPLSERTVEQTIDALVSSGMRDAGYRYVNLDAGWAAPTRDADGDLRADPDRFPGGIAAVARYAHDRGLLLGLSHPFKRGLRAGPADRQRRARGVDAACRVWGVDYLKYDWCRLDADHGDQVRYFATRCGMRCAPAVVGFYSINTNSSGVRTRAPGTTGRRSPT